MKSKIGIEFRLR